MSDNMTDRKAGRISESGGGFRLGIRLAVIVLCVLFTVSCVGATIDMAAEWMDSKNDGQDMEGYDYYLYDGSYMGLRSRLAYHIPTGDKFAVYWDVSDAYEAFSVYDFWQRAAEQGISDQGYAARYQSDLRRVYERSSEDAKRLIRSFAKNLLP